MSTVHRIQTVSCSDIRVAKKEYDQLNEDRLTSLEAISVLAKSIGDVMAIMGGCRNSIFEFFEFFSANNSLKSSKFSESKSKTWPVF